MDKSFFDLGIPAYLSIREVVWSYCNLELNHKDLDTIFEQLQRSYAERRANLQPTYAQFSAYRLYLKYEYFKKKILEFPNWSETEIIYWQQHKTFK